MYQKYVNSVSILLVGIFSSLVGILILIKQVPLYEEFIRLLSILIFISGLSMIGKSLFERNKKVGLVRGFFNMILSFGMLLFPFVPYSVLPLVCALYLFVNGVVYLVYYLVLTKNKVKGRYIQLFQSLFFFILAIPLFFAPLMNLKYVLILLGIYLLLFGVTSITNFIGELIPSKSKKKIKRKMTISLPIFLTTFIPYSILNDINYSLEGEKPTKILKEKKNSEEYDLEVFVHVSKLDSSGTIGHVDLFYDQEIISYGNYDMKSRKLFDTIGDGVLFTCKKKEDYIKFCQKHSKKILFGFGLKLTEKQKKSVKKEFLKLKDEIYEWTPYYKRALEDKREIDKDEYQDYASILYKMTHAKFYKFKGGKFKTFFIFTTNCVALADRILGAAGAGIMKITGFVSPGSYYDYLYREFCRKNSMVVSYQVYTKDGNFYG